MVRLNFKIPVFIAFSLLIFISCNKDEDVSLGKASFSFVLPESNAGSRVMADAKKILVSVKNNSGNLVYDKKELSLYDFSGNLLSEPLALGQGSYTLVDFIVLNKDNNVIYVTPKEGSELAHLVADPLPINFSIQKDQVTNVVPEVIVASGYAASQFGYSSFSFKVINTQSFLASVFVYDPSSQSLQLTSHAILIKSGATLLYAGSLGNITNRLTIVNTGSTVTLTISKSGYATYTKDFTPAELVAYENTPLTVVLLNQSLSNGLVAYYPFSGNSNDNSGNNLHGTVNGATLSSDRHGIANSAYSFNGSSYISVAHNELINFGNTDDFSISLWAWVDPAQIPDGGINDIIRKWSGDTQGYPFAISFDNESAPVGYQRTFLGARYNNSICYNVATGYSGVISYSTFHHIALTKQGSVLKLYIDNVLASTFTDISGCSTKNTSHMTIGCRGQLARFFTGKIDDIRIYNRALQLSEISELYKE